MVEVPQEEFSLKDFKKLNEELINKVKRPDKIYEKQKWMNPKHSKKLSSIEDFVTVLPTSAESQRPQNSLYEASFTSVGAINAGPSIEYRTEQSDALLALTNDDA